MPTTLVAVVPTTDSNRVKITLSESLGITGTFDTSMTSPERIRPWLSIEGLEQFEVSGAEVVLTRDANLDWGTILDELRRVLAAS